MATKPSVRIVDEGEMTWIFARDQKQIRVEHRYETHTGEFVVHINHPGGHRETKRFANALAFRTWVSALGEQLEANHWTPSGPVPLGLDGQPLEGAGGHSDRLPTTTTERTYTSGAHTFELSLARRSVKGLPFWMIERVFERGEAIRLVTVPGVQSISSVSADETFARACDCIDKWVWAHRSGR